MVVCDICNKEFAHIYEHRRVHDPESKFSCSYPDCTKSYVCRSGLASHVRVAHTKERPFQCSFDECTKAFPTYSERVFHERTHTQIAKYECLICGKTFPTFSQHYKHQFTHAGLRFICEVPGCTKSYNQPYPLNNHYKISHPGFVRSNP
jgi:uncharacterized Zn-finger protein